MYRIINALNSWIFKRVAVYGYQVNVRERSCRMEFFYNAFKTLSFNGIDGDYVEFGCWGGETFSQAYHEAARHGHGAKLWAFDSFEGLPAPKGDKDIHPMWVEGNMATTLSQFYKLCDVHGLPRDAYKVVAGFYDKTLSEMEDKDLPDNIALAYIDCDLYSSTRDVMQFIMPRLKHGMIIAFDDYFCYSASQISGERKAMLEFFSENDEWELVPYMQFGWHGLSFIIESKRFHT